MLHLREVEEQNYGEAKIKIPEDLLINDSDDLVKSLILFTYQNKIN